MSEPVRPKGRLRRRTPTVIQMEAVECGAAALAIILGYYGRFEPLEKLRVECGVSRDGSKAGSVLKAARAYGMNAKGFKKDLQGLFALTLPVVVFWEFNHFLVVEGYDQHKVFLNDPANGPRSVSWEDFNRSFTGVVLEITPGEGFRRGGSPRSVWRGLRRRARGSFAGMSYVALASLMLVVPGVIAPSFLQIFVDKVLGAALHSWVPYLLAAMVTTVFVQMGLTWLQQVFLARLGTSLTVATSAGFFWHILNLPMDFYNQRFAGDISNRVEINDRVSQLLSGQLATSGFNLVMIAFYIPVMLMYDVSLTVVAIVLATINVVALTAVSRSRKDINLRLAQEQGKFIGITIDGLVNIETLKASGREGDFFTRWSGSQAKLVNATQELGLISQLLSALPSFISQAGGLLVLIIGGLRVMDGHMTLGMLMAFRTLMSQFLGPVSSLVSLGSKLQEVESDIARLDDILDNPMEARATTTERTPLEGRVELKNITFGYDPTAPPLLDNFNLVLEPGQRVALVGSTGSGKSTIGRLICGLFQPWSGEVLFDGRPLPTIPPEVLAGSLSQVDQSILLFEGTLRDNLTLWNSAIPLEAMERAVQDAGIAELVAHRGGLEGRVDEGGKNFSGGERQRLEIARALTSDPRILILDEATSALDPLVEKQIDDRLRARGCTCVIVAHRLSTIRDCDEIVVLERGKVVERGSHEELVASKGAYFRLVSVEMEGARS
jgi:ATP-binding cassette subfamily C protein